MTRVLVTGASGFVGRGVVQALRAAGHEVFAASREGRRVEGARGLGMDVTDEGSVRLAVDAARPEAVVHLVGIIAEKGRQTFQAVHVDATRHVLGALPPSTRYVHMSALGARADSASRYSSSKARAEALVRESGLPATIFRPSLIFGPGDDFFGRVLKGLVTAAPIVPQIGDGRFPFRPVSRADVAAAFVGALTRPEAIGQTYTLTGPTEFTFRQLLELELQALGKRKPIVAIPVPLMNLAVPLMQVLPSPPITRDQYAMLLEGNTGDPEPARRTFALPMRELPLDLPAIVRGQPLPEPGTPEVTP